MSFPNSTSGALLMRDRIIVRTPEPYFYQLAERHAPYNWGTEVQTPPATSCLADSGPFILPMLVRMDAHEGPKFYLEMHGSIVDFLYGSFVGIYIGYQCGYLQNGVDLRLLRYFKMGTDGSIEAGGTPWKWLKLTWENLHDSLYILWRFIVYGMAGGITQTITRLMYRWLFCDDGHIVPAFGTFVLMSIGDDSFFRGHRILGNLIYYTAIFETSMMFMFKANSTYWMRHFLERYILKAFRFLHRPSNWWSWYSHIRF